jgi:hypothetical protein
MTRSAISVPPVCWFDTDEILGRQIVLGWKMQNNVPVWLAIEMSDTHSTHEGYKLKKSFLKEQSSCALTIAKQCVISTCDNSDQLL